MLLPPTLTEQRYLEFVVGVVVDVIERYNLGFDAVCPFLKEVSDQQPKLLGRAVMTAHSSAENERQADFKKYGDT